MRRMDKIMDASLPDRLEYAASHACDPACEGRCKVCPAEVMREAAAALRATIQPALTDAERLAEAVAVLKQVNGCRDGLCAECQYKLDNFLRPTVSASGGEA